MAEVSDQELAQLRGAKALLEKMTTGKTRREAEQLIKKVVPEANTTDDILEPYTHQIDTLSKKVDDFINESKGARLDARLQRDINKLREERDYTDEGIEKLKKMMVEKQIPDITVAADHYERQNPPVQQEPSLISPTSWGFGRDVEGPDKESVAALFKDEDAWADREAAKAWNEEVKKRGQIIT